MEIEKSLEIFYGDDRLSGNETVSYHDLEGVYKIAGGAFNRFSKLKTINIPKNVVEIETYSFDHGQLETINVEKENEVYSSIDGVLFNKDGTALIKYPSNRKGEIYIVPQNVKKIYPNSFCYSKYLKKIILPEGLEEIEDMAFYNCGKMHSIYIPKNVRKIGYSFIYFHSDDYDNFKYIYNASDVWIHTSIYSGNAKIVNIVGVIDKEGKISDFKEDLHILESTTNNDIDNELVSLYNYLSKDKSDKFKEYFHSEKYYRQSAYNFFDNVKIENNVVAIYGTSYYKEAMDDNFGGGTEYYSHLAFTGAWDEWGDKEYINKIKNNGWHFATPYYNASTKTFYETPEYDDWNDYSMRGGLIIQSDGITAYHIDDCQEELIFKGKHVKNKIAYENLGTEEDCIYSLCDEFIDYGDRLPEGAEYYGETGRVAFRKLEDLAKYVTFNIFGIQ